MTAVSANAITTIHIAAKTVGAAEARRQVARLLQILDVAPVTRVVLDDAVRSKMRIYSPGDFVTMFHKKS